MPINSSLTHFFSIISMMDVILLKADIGRVELLASHQGFMSEFRDTGNIKVGRSDVASQGTMTWSPHNPGMYKLNTDAAIDKTGQCVDLGMVIRDSMGFIMVASSQKISASFNPQIAVAIAIKQGFQFARDSGLNPVVVESDATVVRNWIKNGTCATMMWVLLLLIFVI
ncbi:hypothetical protein Dsin_005078 [Dipteronia sinensis]|uniref:RNase H type-1 domain-containing protein n=1 Tax=Dipteronia sinensis TaxID=43782 RepID=A0AAE0EED0_9ROSI|nr:hypothetical protein Dsin_005078 [Dipteronia sinensis]